MKDIDYLGIESLTIFLMCCRREESSKGKGDLLRFCKERKERGGCDPHYLL